MGIQRIQGRPLVFIHLVGNGAVAIHRFTDTANRITDIIELMPEAMRWQLLLFLFEIEETE